MPTQPVSTSHHLRGWIPDSPDQRDFRYAQLRPVANRDLADDCWTIRA